MNRLARYTFYKHPSLSRATVTLVNQLDVKTESKSKHWLLHSISMGRDSKNTKEVLAEKRGSYTTSQNKKIQTLLPNFMVKTKNRQTLTVAMTYSHAPPLALWKQIHLKI